MDPQDMPEDDDGSKVIRLPTHRTWVPLYDSLWDHPVVGMYAKTPRAHDPARSSINPMLMWAWMTRTASRKPFKHSVGGRAISLARGQLVLTERHLAKTANWSRKAAAGWMAKLRRLDMIAMTTATPDGQFTLDFHGTKKGPSRGPSVTIVTICNFDVYQFALQEQGTRKGAKKGPGRGQESICDTEIDSKKPACTQYDPASLRADDAVISNLIEWHSTHDEIAARGWLNELIDTYGEGPCRKAYNKVVSRRGSGKVSSPIGLWRTIAEAVFNGEEEPQNVRRASNRERMRIAREANGEGGE